MDVVAEIPAAEFVFESAQLARFTGQCFETWAGTDASRALTGEPAESSAFGANPVEPSRLALTYWRGVGGASF
jgi:hypothetical protein